MTLLFIYLALAIGVSFLCSLCEAVLLTLTVSDAEVMVRTGNQAGTRLRKFKQTIDRPLAAILTLNTISHTVGAAGVGAQSIKLFGNAWIGVTSAILTLLILVVSEIIPKTIGATNARLLAGPATWAILAMMWLTYPVVIMLDAISGLMRGGGRVEHLTREQIEVVAELARSGGALKPAESKLLTNLLRLQDIRAEDIMTPRTVVLTVPRTATARSVLDTHKTLRFSRIPVTGDGPDDILGFVLKHDIHRAMIDGRPDTRVDKMLRPIRAVPESANLVAVMEQFGELGQHLFLVVDEYGGTSGIVTLEDLLETILGAEIVDETDPVADMRKLASPDGEDAPI
jgi:CBS domain containing-hemolysin-like protein